MVITTKDRKQLEQQLYPALTRHRSKFPLWKWTTSPDVEITTNTGSRLVAFTTNDPGRAEGWHKRDNHYGPLLVIVDEAKSVEEEIFQAIDRCTFNSLLYVSSPGPRRGSFFDAFTRHADLFQRRKVSLLECPHIPRERIDSTIAKYGARHPLTLSSMHGEFMDQDEMASFVFPLPTVQSVLQSPPPVRLGDRSAFCDFAAGRDENVLALRTGNKVEIVAAWRDRDTQAAIGRFLLEFTKAGLLPHEIFADEGGLGRPMLDSMARAGWEINRVNNGARAHVAIYENRGSEMWHETAAALVRGEIVLPPADDDLVAQLTTRRTRVSSLGRLGMEPKHELAKRNLPSPDRADALCGAWSNRAPASPNPFDDWRDNLTPQDPAGMPAGY